MQILGLGLDYTTGQLLVQPRDEHAFADAILESLGRNAPELRDLTRATTRGGTYRGEMQRRVVDLGDPRSAGWTFLVNAHDPDHEKLIGAIQPLARHRGMHEPQAPLLFNGEPADEWENWLSENYSALQMETKPHYILILGPPAQVPYLFQAMLATSASVGRLDFAAPGDLEAYVEKIVRLETAQAPVVTPQAIFFATDAGTNDPTYYSHHYLAEPLAEHVKTQAGLKTQTLFGQDATKARLQEALRGAKPALVFTASHGMGAPAESLAVQQRVNGAICCQQSGRERKDDEWVFTADDVPQAEPFLEGAAFFQFACYGYGTPAESDFAHWDASLGLDKLNAKADFIAALPRRLLAHPRGPVTYVGHVDVALLHGFDDPGNPVPALGERWSPRIEPFYTALTRLLGVQPAGMAMEDMNTRYNVQNALLTGVFDRLQRKKIKVDAAFQERLASAFLMRSDAQNYMIFGDPAAHLRIPD